MLYYDFVHLAILLQHNHISAAVSFGVATTHFCTMVVNNIEGTLKCI